MNESGKVEHALPGLLYFSFHVLLLLALFLPVHFLVLSQAVSDPQGFADTIAWTDRPLVKAAEFGLVFLLATHLFGGLRLLVLELTPWQPWQKGWAAAA